MRSFFAVFALVLWVFPIGAAPADSSGESIDAIVVGAGIAGLSAALELGRGGARVTVVEMASVFGGHAVMAQGLLNIVATPYQKEHGVHDSPDLAYDDFVQWGEDPNPEWLRYYVDHSKEEIFDWLTGMGVVFEGLDRPPGNTVPRGHNVAGRGIAMVSPVYRECLETPTVSFLWNIRVDRLLRSRDRIVGVIGTDLRSGAQIELRAKIVILATGGFQSNLDKVRASWPKAVPFPEHLLLGGGINARGSGLDLAVQAGAELSRLDHQWNYITGLPDPRYPGTTRGLHAVVRSIWVNIEGHRFMAEYSSPKEGMAALLRQKGQTYWAIFGPTARQRFYVSGSDWGDFSVVEKRVLENPLLVKKADTVEHLAQLIGVPADALGATVARYNELVRHKSDDDFGLFKAGDARFPPLVDGPPFYAAQFFPLTRKSMGGVSIDGSSRVLDREHRIIPGLYAAGELTGLAGINGKAGLEGTFLGPSLVTGRVAGRAALVELDRRPAAAPTQRLAHPSAVRSTPADDARCLTCHELPALVAQPREGFWHFETVHRRVLEDQRSCSQCHAEISVVVNPVSHRFDRLAQIQACRTCHRGEQN